MIGYYKVDLKKMNIREGINVEKDIYEICCPLVVLDKQDLPRDLSCLYHTLEIPIITLDELKDFNFNQYKDLETYVKELSYYLKLNAEIELLEDNDIGHVLRVGYYSKKLAESIHLNKQEIKELYLASLLHDIGKYDIPKEIIGKKGKLTDEEFELIKKHCINAKNLLSNFFSENVIEMVKAHHERCNKTGYPLGVCPNLGAKIIGITDSYDAMTSDRVYAKRKSKEEAFKELRLCTKPVTENGKGVLYDKKLVEEFIKIINEIELEA